MILTFNTYTCKLCGLSHFKSLKDIRKHLEGVHPTETAKAKKLWDKKK